MKGKAILDSMTEQATAEKVTKGAYTNVYIRVFESSLLDFCDTSHQGLI